MLNPLALFITLVALQTAPPAKAPAAAPPSPMAAKLIELMDFMDKNEPESFAEGEAGRKQAQEWNLKQDAFRAQLMAGIDPTSLKLSELAEYRDLFPASQAAAIEACIEKGASAEGPDAIDCLMAMQRATDPSDRAAMKAVMDRMFTSPYLGAWMDLHGVRPFAQVFSRAPSRLLAPHKDVILAMADRFKPTVGGTDGIALYMQLLSGLGDAVPAEQREAVRVRLLDLAKQALVLARGGGDPKSIGRLERAVGILDSNVSKGKFINHEAPDIDFIWAADRNGLLEFKTLDDLKGKIVVLDFWATWCGPCIASFPKIKELRAHYSSDDVVVLGVTSLHGRHYPKGKPSVDTKDNPALEQQLMAEYIKDVDITWQIAFSKADVINPAYEVMGIPHIAIIDAKGVLRHNGLHPSVPMAQKTKLIDALLVEQGKPVPALAAPQATTTTDSPAAK